MKCECTLKLVGKENTEITMGSTYRLTPGSLCYHGEKEKLTKFKYACKHKKGCYYSGGKFDDPGFHTTVQRNSRIIYQSHPHICNKVIYQLS
jgi:hypothetical protein